MHTSFLKPDPNPCIRGKARSGFRMLGRQDIESVTHRKKVKICFGFNVLAAGHEACL